MARVKIGNVFPSDAYLLQRCAPAGYVDGKYTSNSKGQLDVIIKEAYSEMADKSQRIINVAHNLIDGLPGGNWYITLKKSTINYGQAEATLYSAYNGGIQVYRRSLFEGEWGAWATVNPLMEPGLEYLTEEKWNMKPVYTTYFSFGVVSGLPAAITTEFSAAHVIRCNGTMGGSCLPIINGTLDNENSAYVNATVNNGFVRIEIVCGSGMIGKAAGVQVWYTKT